MINAVGVSSSIDQERILAQYPAAGGLLINAALGLAVPCDDTCDDRCFAMNALLLTEYMHLEMAEMPTPEIGPDDVLVRVRACGICGSDVHGMDGKSGRRIPPLVMGHEASGEVVETGA